MAEDRIEIEIVLDDGSIQKGFAKIRKEGKKTEKSLGKNFRRALSQTSGTLKGLTSSVFNLKTAFVGAAAAFGGVQLLKQITTASATQQDAVNKLNASLSTAGSFSDAASESFQNLAKELQSQSRFGDEVILQQAALARNYTTSNEEAEALLRTSIDLAEATGSGLDSAIRNLGKTFSGLTGELGEAVPIIRGLTTEQLKAGGAIKLLSQRFGGTALAATRTYSGAVDQLGNTFGDFVETLGDAITKSPAVVGLIKGFSKFFSEMEVSLKTADLNFNEFFKNVIKNTLTFAELILIPFKKINNFLDDQRANLLQLEIAWKNLSLSISESTNFLNKIRPDLVVGKIKKSQDTLRREIGALESTLSELAESNSNFNDTVTSIENGIKRLTVTIFSSIAEVERSGIGKAITNSLMGAGDAAALEIDKLKLAVLDLQDKSLDIIANTFFSDPEDFGGKPFIFANLANMSKVELDKMKKNLKKFVDDSGNEADAFNKNVSNALARGIASGITSMVEAIKNGENALSAFAKNFLAVIGDLAIQVGTMIIAAGFALLELFKANPGGAIAFGAALVAVGALLKAASGSGQSGAAPGASDAVTSPLLDPNEAIADQLEGRGAQVQVTIEGNIFDSDSTGLRIAEILREQGLNNAVIS